MKKAVLLITACQFLLMSTLGAQNSYLIDIRPLEKDIRKIQQLKPLRPIEQKGQNIPSVDRRKTSSQKADIELQKPK